MRRKLVLSIGLLCVSVTFAVAYAFLRYPFLASFVPPYDSSQNPVNIVFKFGVGAKNELNTFNGTFTKDLIIDGTTTTRLIMSQEELSQIQRNLIEMGFFNYPETFPFEDVWTAPPTNYYLMVQNGSTVKELTWSTNSKLDSTTEDKLNQFADLVINIIIEKPEYKMLPPPNGGYL